MESKRDTRKRVLSLRENMKETEWEHKSRQIIEKVVTHSFFLESDLVLCYVNYLKEVDTRKIIQTCFELGKQVAVPKVHGSDMEFYIIESIDELKPGFKGILEPITNQVPDYEKGIVILPGAVFDKTRNRIGYGKGYYDKFLDKHSSLKSIAIAFEFQVLDKIISEEHDFIPDILITEEHIYV